ncbi:MAG: transporter [Saprospiraceae bacterium]|nr:transporter [Saprospiraceae bacterium]
MKIFITTILLIIFGQINAQIITDRPDQTEGSSSVGDGNLQIESGLLLGFENDNGKTVQQILAPTTLFRYGITDGIELRLVHQFETLKFQDKRTSGISDFEIGTKIELWNKAESKSEVAFLSHLIVPTGTKELGSDKFGTVNKLSISHDVGDGFALGYNVGYDYFGEGKGNFTYALAFGIGINDKVSVYIEPYGDVLDFEALILNFDTGFTYLANDNLQFDFSFGLGINHQMNYVSAGVSWRILR